MKPIIITLLYLTTFGDIKLDSFDLEQKVNGVIKYVLANEQTQFKASILPDEDQHG